MKCNKMTLSFLIHSGILMCNSVFPKDKGSPFTDFSERKQNPTKSFLINPRYRI